MALTHPLTNQAGVSIIEMMMGSMIALLAVAGITTAFLQQHRIHENQKMAASADQSIRTGISLMAKQIRLARAGADPGTAIFQACGCRLWFQSNRNGGHSIMTSDSAGPTIPVESIAGFAIGNPVSITNWSLWESRVIAGVQASPPALTLDSAFPATWAKGSVVFQNRSTLFDLDIAGKRLLMDGQLLAAQLKLDPNGLFQGEPLFRYFKEDNTELVPPGTGDCRTTCLGFSDRVVIRKIGIKLTVETDRPHTPNATDKTAITQQTIVMLRHPTP